MRELAWNARITEERVTGTPGKPESVTYIIGVRALTPAAVRLIIKRTARRAADEGVVALFGSDLNAAIAALSMHSLRVGLTQGLFASGEDAGPIAQAAVKLDCYGVALRAQAGALGQRHRADAARGAQVKSGGRACLPLRFRRCRADCVHCSRRRTLRDAAVHARYAPAHRGGRRRSTFHRRTQGLGRTLLVSSPAPTQDAAEISLMLDTTFIRSNRSDAERGWEILIGAAEAETGARYCFGAPINQRAASLKLIKDALSEVGCTPATRLTAFTDGAPVLRGLAARVGIRDRPILD